MGFYSIYKIIKDIIRTLFGNKFLKSCLIVFIINIVLLFIFYIPNVFATYTTEYNGQTVTISDNIINSFDYYWFVTSGNDVSSFIYANSPITYARTGGTDSEPIYTFYAADGINATGSSFSTVKWFVETENWSFESINSSNTSYSSYIGSGGLYSVFTNSDIFNTNGDLAYSSDLYTPPTLNNPISDLENLSFNNFIINANSFTQEMISNSDEPLVMLFYNRSLSNSQNTDGLYPIKEKYFYKESIYFDKENSTDSNYIFKYPIFKTGVFFNIGSTYEIKLAKRVYIQEYDTWGYDYFANSYTFTVSSNVTQDYINQLNQQTATSSDEEQQQELQSSINQQTQSIDNINNSITDSTIDNSSIDLPTDNTQDPTQSGVDNIFQTIYNSFTSGTAQDIVFPIPFSDNNLTIQANYVSNMLGSSSRR